MYVINVTVQVYTSYQEINLNFSENQNELLNVDNNTEILPLSPCREQRTDCIKPYVEIGMKGYGFK